VGAFGEQIDLEVDEEASAEQIAFLDNEITELQEQSANIESNEEDVMTKILLDLKRVRSVSLLSQLPKLLISIKSSHPLRLSSLLSVCVVRILSPNTHFISLLLTDIHTGFGLFGN